MTHLDRIHESIDAVRDSLTVRRVYGDPIERDGTLIIPAASVRGGAGGGGGTDMSGNVGGGHGFGVQARPVGAFVVRDGVVHWEPVVDRDRQLVITATIVAMSLLTLRALARRRRRHHRHRHH